MGRYSNQVVLALATMASMSSPFIASAKMMEGRADRVGSIYKSVRTVMNVAKHEQQEQRELRKNHSNVRAHASGEHERELATGPGTLTTRCFTECIEQAMTPEECEAYIQSELDAAGGHEVGDVSIKIQVPRPPPIFDETYWMVEVPVNINSQFTCDRNNGKTYFPFEWNSPTLGSIPVHDIDCQGLSAGQCCLAVKAWGQSELGGKDVNGYCLGCFPHQEPLVPVCNTVLGTTEYQDYVYDSSLPVGSQCEKFQLTEAEVLTADAVTADKISLASTAFDSFLASPTCVGFDGLLEKLYDASVVISPLPQYIGELACKYCYGDGGDLDVSTVGSSTVASKITNLLSSTSFTPSTENCIIIYTDPEGNIVDIPKLGGSRADDPYDDDCEDEGEGNDCPPGFYAPPGSSGDCLPCPEGTYEQGGVCLPCEAGTFSTGGAHICTPCEDRTISTGGASVCEPCSEGYLEVGNTVCEICPAGTCQAGALNECVPCELGLFQPLAGQNFCLQCPRGTYADVEGLTECKDCPEGSAADRGSSECTVCIPPQVVSRREDRCVDSL